MDKVEVKELVKAISGLTKIQQEHNKVIDKLVSTIKESLNNVKNTQANV